jgi:hypothetical protein
MPDGLPEGRGKPIHLPIGMFQLIRAAIPKKQVLETQMNTNEHK